MTLYATPQFIDPVELARIADLSLLARTVVEGYLAGLHRSPYTGASIEFAQYRPYTQSDDPRSIDWKLYGRTDRLHIKQYQEETNLRCTVLIDCSASMDYGSGAVTKFHYARMLAACLATILVGQRDAVGMIAYDAALRKHIPPRADPNQLRRIMIEIENLRPAGSTDTAKALQSLGELLKPRGMAILISDLLHPLEGVIERLRSLRARRHDTLVFVVGDPAEETFPFDRTLTLIDAESDAEQYTVPEAVREAYLDNRRAHFETIRRECHAAEIELAILSTGEPLDRALHVFMRRRNHALMTSSLKRARTGGGR